MIDGKLVLALIPARGGSKGILRKNIALLMGKPLLSYTIEAALSSVFVDEVWVSSEDYEILQLASMCGARIVTRPHLFASDAASSVCVVEHFIAHLSNEIRSQDPIILYLQPTSPLRNGKHIDDALKAMNMAGAKALMSVVEAEKPPQKSFQLDENGRLISLFDERQSNARRQDLPLCYYPNGAIYAFQVSEFLERNGFPSNGSIPFVMSCADSIDIDKTTDLKRAELAIGEKNGRV